MQRHIISVNSITYALKGRDALRRQGIKAYTERKVNERGNVGCGYVIVAFGNREKIMQTLLNSNVKILEINSDI